MVLTCCDAGGLEWSVSCQQGSADAFGMIAQRAMHQLRVCVSHYVVDAAKWWTTHCQEDLDLVHQKRRRRSSSRS